MKKILLLACFGWFLMNGLLAQEIDFKYKVDSTLTKNSKYFEITVTLTKGESPCIFELFDKSPTLGGKTLVSSGVVNSNTFKFAELQIDDYYIYVYSSNREIGRGKRILIKSKNL